LAVTGILAKEIIGLLYGMNWAESAVVVPYLCIVFGIQATFSLLQSALTAIGRPYINAAPLAFGLALKLSFSFSLFDGSLKSFCYAICIGEALTMPLYFVMAKRFAGAGFKQWMQGLSQSMIVLLLVSISAMFFYEIAPDFLSDLWRGGYVGLASIGVWITIIVLINHPLKKEIYSIIH